MKSFVAYIMSPSGNMPLKQTDKNMVCKVLAQKFCACRQSNPQSVATSAWKGTGIRGGVQALYNTMVIANYDEIIKNTKCLCLPTNPWSIIISEQDPFIFLTWDTPKEKLVDFLNKDPKYSKYGSLFNVGQLSIEDLHAKLRNDVLFYAGSLLGNPPNTILLDSQKGDNNNYKESILTYDNGKLKSLFRNRQVDGLKSNVSMIRERKVLSNNYEEIKKYIEGFYYDDFKYACYKFVDKGYQVDKANVDMGIMTIKNPKSNAQIFIGIGRESIGIVEMSCDQSLNDIVGKSFTYSLSTSLKSAMDNTLSRLNLYLERGPKNRPQVGESANNYDMKKIFLNNISKAGKYVKRTDYKVTARRFKAGETVYNYLEDCEYSGESQNGRVVLKGTVGEEWTVKPDKILSTYNITKEDLIAKTANGGSVSLTPKDNDPTVYLALRIPKEKVGYVEASWGKLNVNKPINSKGQKVNHGNGDYIICAENNPDDCWVINGAVFPNTYKSAT